MFGGRMTQGRTSPMKVLKSAGPKLVPFFKSVAVYFVLLPDSASMWTAGVKCAPVLSLMIFVLLHGVGRGDEYAYSRRILVGLGLSCVGDALLVWPQHFLAGMAAFGAAQAAYSGAFGFRPLRPALGALVYAVTSPAVWRLLPGAHGPLKVGVPVYAALLAATVWRAAARVPAAPRPWTRLSACAGSLSFAVSDALIGFHHFHAPVGDAQVLIMSTYYLAQLGIALSVMDSAADYRGSRLQAPAARTAAGDALSEQASPARRLDCRSSVDRTCDS